MAKRDGTNFITSTEILDIDTSEHQSANKDLHKGSVNMGDFPDSFNMIFGSTDLNINLLDNPYVEILVYELDEEYKPKPSETIKLSKCKKEDLN